MGFLLLLKGLSFNLNGYKKNLKTVTKAEKTQGFALVGVIQAFAGGGCKNAPRH
ncbi:MAG: Kef-type K+ transport system membrane component KefB [Psychromonas sp.]